MRRAAGFTIIELIAVIVILGVLGAVALPRYLNMSASARSAACGTWRGTLESAAALNFGARISAGAGTSALITCTGLAPLVSGGVLPTSLSVSGTFNAGAVTNGTTGTCTIEYSAGGGTCNTTVTMIGVN
jgi:MSHA pilin protein MshA